MKILCFLFILHPLFLFSQSKAEKIDSLKSVIESNINDSVVVKALSEWNNLIPYSDVDLDFKLSLKIDSICDLNLKNPQNKASNFFLLEKARVQTNLGLIYNSRGQFTLAMDCYDKSLEIYEALDYKDGIASVLTNYGNFYDFFEEYDKAMEYHNRALKIDREAGSEIGIAYDLNNIGLIHADREEYETALKFYEEGLAISKKLDNKNEIGNFLNNIGLVYLDLKDYDQAITKFKESMLLFENIGAESGIAASLNNLAGAYLEKKQFDKAIQLGSRALKISKAAGIIFSQRSAYDILYRGYKGIGDSRVAIEMLEQSKVLTDSINTSEVRRELAQQEFKFQLDNQKKEDSIVSAEAIKVKNAELATSRAEAKVQKQQKMYLYIGLGALILFGFFSYNRFKITQRQRNTIAAQKQIVEKQKLAVESQKEKMEIQHEELEVIHKEISDSINYAERLQLAILPALDDLQDNLGSGFVFFQPKDMVSGDFYWMEDLGDTSLIAVADCTGHGVPGALISVVCSNALNRSVKEFGLTEPKDILDKTTELVVETFAGSAEDIQDGMDIALCSIPKNNSGSQDLLPKKILFSGANNPLWIIRKTKYLTEIQRGNKSTITKEAVSLIEFKATRQSIGLYSIAKSFEQNEIKVFEGDVIYIFTDGFADQFGGEKGKKMKYKPFKESLLEVSELDISLQKEALETIFNSWKGSYEQLDDICVLGLEI